MKPTDLRLNNYVEYGHEICQIAEIDNQHVALLRPTGYSYLISSNNIAPITLSEEWLLKLGFEFVDTNSDCFNNYFIPENKYGVAFCIKSVDGYAEKGFAYCSKSDVEISTVHHLQNLIYAITGIELTLKPTQE